MKQLAIKDNSAEFRYFGGDYMQEAGGRLTVHYKQLAFMGFLEVVKNLGTIKKYIGQCKSDIEEFAPDVIILIDYAGFNLRIAKWASKQGYKVVYYISPKLWAWNSKRAYKIKCYVNHLFAIMPFEPKFYKQFDYPNVSYVGNPVVDAIASFSPDPEFRQSLDVNNTDKLIAVLPGSRKQELQYILPVITELIKKNQEFTYLVAAVGNLDEHLYDELRSLANVKLITGHTYNILAIADAALVTSGTATLETGLWKVPQVVLYKGNPISMFIAKMLVKVKYISLVNLILDEPCVVELIQEDCTAAKIEIELNNVIKSPTDYSALHQIIGNHHASEIAASGIINFLLQE